MLHRAPPLPVTERPQLWRNLLAAARLAAAASEGRCNQLPQQLYRMLLFAPNNFGEVEAHHLELISDDVEVRPLIGQLWGAAKVSIGYGSYTERLSPSFHVNAEWIACQLAAAVAVNHLGDRRQQWDWANGNATA